MVWAPVSATELVICISLHECWEMEYLIDIHIQKILLLFVISYLILYCATSYFTSVCPSHLKSVTKHFHQYHGVICRICFWNAYNRSWTKYILNNVCMFVMFVQHIRTQPYSRPILKKYKNLCEWPQNVENSVSKLLTVFPLPK